MTSEREDLSSASGLIRGLLDDVRELFRQEILLARAEVREEVGHATSAAVRLAAAAVLLLLTAVFALTALAWGLVALFQWPVWSGFALVALILAIAGGWLFASGRREMREIRGVAPQTAESLKENTAWIKNRLGSERR
jgi:uncharacterized integral membrane protein